MSARSRKTRRAMGRPTRPATRRRAGATDGIGGRFGVLGVAGAPLGAAWALLLAAAPLGAQMGAEEIARRVASAPDGWVRFAYEPRPGVCGNGRWISVDGDTHVGRGGECDCACEDGPVRIELGVRDGVARDLDAEVGGSWEPRSGAVTDLGTVEPQAGADYLLDLAATGESEAAEQAIFPATIARGVEAWPRLLEIARADDARRRVRKQAVFWLGQEASDRATEGLESIIEDEEELEVREHAVFALSQQPSDRAVTALLRVARDNPEPEIRKKAIFWLGQHDDPRVLALFEELLIGSP
ncbi:MAG: HEAT repeat domain-containing protein [Gemmatimonadota bacterium]